MADYVIGDVQGCYNPLMRLLESIRFDDKNDTLWFVGDLVNRGPQSLEVLIFIKNLKTAKITLGNHDFHLLHNIYSKKKQNSDDTLQPILWSPYRDELGNWLRQQKLLYHDPQLNIVMCHAGIAPDWNLETAILCAEEIETILQSNLYLQLLDSLYGNRPNHWDPNLTGTDRWRLIINFFTRMRFCTTNGDLDLAYKGDIAHAPKHLKPWFQVQTRQIIEEDIVFGHWAALQGLTNNPKIFAVDTGCLWGGRLTALRLQDRRLFSVSGQ